MIDVEQQELVLDKVFFFLVIASVPSIPFWRIPLGSFELPFTVLPILIGYASCRSLQLLGQRNVPQTMPGITLTIVAFLLWSAVSMVWASQPDATLRRVLHSLSDLCFLIVILHFSTLASSSVFRLMRFFPLLMLIPLAIGFHEFFQRDADNFQFIFPPRLMGDRNSDGFMILTALPFAFVMAIGPAIGVWWRVVGLVCATVGGYAVFLTLSRTNLVLTGLVIFIIVSARMVLSRANRSLVILNVVLCIFVTWGVYTQLPDKILHAEERFGERFEEDNDLRVAFLEGTWDLTQRAPFFGVGAGNFGLKFSQTKSGRTIEGCVSSHNSFLATLCELGFPGLIMFLGILFWPVFRLAFMFPRIALCEDSTVVNLYVSGAALSVVLALSPITVSMTDDFYYWIAFLFASLIVVALQRSLATSSWGS